MTKITAEQASRLPLGEGISTGFRKGLDGNLSVIAMWSHHMMGHERWTHFVSHVRTHIAAEGRFDAATLMHAALSWDHIQEAVRPREDIRNAVTMFRCAMQEFSLKDWLELAQFIRAGVPELAGSYEEDALSFGKEASAARIETIVLNREGKTIARIVEAGDRPKMAPPAGYEVEVFGRPGPRRKFEGFDAARLDALEGVQDVRVERLKLDVEFGAHDRHRAAKVQGALNLGDAWDAAVAEKVGPDAQVLLRKHERVGDERSVEFMFSIREGEATRLDRWKVHARNGAYELEAGHAMTLERILIKLAGPGKAVLRTAVDDDMTVGKVTLEVRDGHLNAAAEIYETAMGGELCGAWASAPLPSNLDEFAPEAAPTP